MVLMTENRKKLLSTGLCSFMEPLTVKEKTALLENYRLNFNIAKRESIFPRKKLWSTRKSLRIKKMSLSWLLTPTAASCIERLTSTERFLLMPNFLYWSIEFLTLRRVLKILSISQRFNILLWALILILKMVLSMTTCLHKSFLWIPWFTTSHRCNI